MIGCGRREDETPFIVEWLVNQGIEVWSTREGEQRFETRVDKLLNYIRYWQAGGESEKTGIRVKERQKQLTKEGIYMSATPPYGYTLVKSGIYSRKGVERRKLQIIPEEANVVKLVYKLCVEEGYGGRRIAMYLNERNIPSKKGVRWTLSVVNYMLRNPIYKGYIAYNKTSVKKNGSQGRVGSEDWILSEQRNEEIAIIDETTWDKVQKIRWAKTPDKYKTENMDYESYPLTTKSDGLLTGIVKCGYCGSKLNLAKNRKNYKRKDGTICEGKKYAYYRCTGKIAGKLNCELKKMCLRKNDIEQPVLDAMNIFLNTLENVDLSKQIEKIKKDNLHEDDEILKNTKKSISSKTNEILKLKDEVMKVILGESAFDKTMLSEMIKNKEKELHELEAKKNKIEKKIDKKQIEFKDMEILKKSIPVWQEEFNLASTECKKMMINQVIKDVEVFDDEIKVKMRLEFDKILSNQFFLQNVLKSGHT